MVDMRFFCVVEEQPALTEMNAALPSMLGFILRAGSVSLHMNVNLGVDENQPILPGTKNEGTNELRRKWRILLHMTSAYNWNPIDLPFECKNHHFGDFMVAQMGVSKNRGTPKWMVYNGNPYKHG